MTAPTYASGTATRSATSPGPSAGPALAASTAPWISRFAAAICSREPLSVAAHAASPVDRTSTRQPETSWILRIVAPALPRSTPTWQSRSRVSPWPLSSRRALTVATARATSSADPDTVHAVPPRGTSMRAPHFACNSLIVAPPLPMSRGTPRAPSSIVSVDSAAISTPFMAASTSALALATWSRVPLSTTADLPPRPASTWAPEDAVMNLIVAPPEPMTAGSLSAASRVAVASSAPGTWPAAARSASTAVLAFATTLGSSPPILHVEPPLLLFSTFKVAPGWSAASFLMVSPPLPMMRPTQPSGTA
mmetsp:Transcript_5630/g.18479  ORF Transcript_5630/g.18479 Transcript_5630/m.18479 type:complete len:307 (+) Transcript_5630:1085-2005(+)